MTTPEPLPNNLGPTRLQQIYDSTATFYDSVVAQHQARAKELAIELLARQPGERFLEIGCGTAWALSRIVAASGAANAAGIDVSPGMLAVARDCLLSDAAIANPPLLVADARALPFANASFDCALTTYTLEVLPSDDIAAVLRDCVRVLRPGGRLVIVNLTEGEGADAAISDEWKRGYLADPEYYSGSRPLVLSPFMDAAGLTLQTRRYSGHGDSWPSEILLATR